jgi:FkbM family methyltransferase
MGLADAVQKRVRAAKADLHLSSRWRDWPNLLVLSQARHGLFERFGLCSRLARRLWPTLALRVDRLNNRPAYLDPNDSTQFTIFDEVVIDNSYDLTKITFSPDTIIDCGAHVGLFTLIASNKYPSATLLAFEPATANCKLIDQLVSSNGLPLKLVRKAVSDREGTATFYTHNSHSGTLGTAFSELTTSQTVETVDLLAVIRPMTDSKLLLKMDIEGEELNVLPSIIPFLPNTTAIFFETHGGQISWDTITTLLIEVGFSVEEIRVRDPYRDGFATRA